ncbi:hypothetical protein HD806DRAFT_534998 [Xylariaceae sp. AK1471]|nr:hypothetical protein HD806DRAFT_534998 [Xylariaceae sp. AK1471]
MGPVFAISGDCPFILACTNIALAETLICAKPPAAATAVDDDDGTVGTEERSEQGPPPAAGTRAFAEWKLADVKTKLQSLLQQKEYRATAVLAIWICPSDIEPVRYRSHWKHWK